MTLSKSFFSALCFVFFAGMLLTSCEKEDISTNNLNSDTSLAERTSNILSTNSTTANNENGKEGECFTFIFPIEVVLPNGTNISTNNEEELETAIEDWYEAQGFEAADPTLTYPISVVLEDGTQQNIQNDNELEDLFEACFGDYFEDEHGYGEDCAGEDEWLEYICFTFAYPIEIQFPNETTTINTDEELEEALYNWYENNEEDPSLSYPVTAILEDGKEQVIQNDEELYQLFESCFDDYEYDKEEDYGYVAYYELYKECFTLNFPIAITVNDQEETLNNEEELIAFLTNLDKELVKEDEVNLVYPIEVTLADGSVVTANSEEELDDLCKD